MPRLIKKFFKAIKLRKQGFSIKEISQKLEIAQSTASLWLRDISLSPKAEKRLEQRISQGQFASARNRKEKSAILKEKYIKNGFELLDIYKGNKDHFKIFCALLYYCEGAKSGDYFQFTNSDPGLIKVFLRLLRESFSIDESKFRISLHLHSYHSNKKQIKFWSGITNVAINQFIKPYRKHNSGKRVKTNYQGCVNIKYYDANLAKEILGIGQAFIQIMGA